MTNEFFVMITAMQENRLPAIEHPRGGIPRVDAAPALHISISDAGFSVRASSRRLLRHGEFENWAVIAPSGIPNKVQVADMVVLTIAHTFMVGSRFGKIQKSRQGRKKCSTVPDGTLKIGLHYSLP
jgi:hypothetical protein